MGRSALLCARRLSARPSLTQLLTDMTDHFHVLSVIWVRTPQHGYFLPFRIDGACRTLLEGEAGADSAGEEIGCLLSPETPRYIVNELTSTEPITMFVIVFMIHERTLKRGEGIRYNLLVCTCQA